MLCSKCNKNTAIIFMNRIENGNSSIEGLCFDCAKSQGINPTEVLSKQSEVANKNNPNMNIQIESMMKDLAKSLEHLDLNNIIVEEVENDNFDSSDNDLNGPESKQVNGFAIPLGSIFGNMFNPNANKSSAENNNANTEKKKVKVDKKKNPKLSYTVGTDAFFAHLVSKLPQVVINKLVRLGMKLRMKL